VRASRSESTRERAILVMVSWTTLCCILEIYRIYNACDKRCEDEGASFQEIGAEASTNALNRRSAT